MVKFKKFSKLADMSESQRQPLFSILQEIMNHYINCSGIQQTFSVKAHIVNMVLQAKRQK